MASRQGSSESDYWAHRISSFLAADADSHAFVRSAPPAAPPPSWSREPRRSTAASLDADVADAGGCALLLVHDSRREGDPVDWVGVMGTSDAELTAAASASGTTVPTPVRWRELGRSLATARHLPASVASNSLPPTPVNTVAGLVSPTPPGTTPMPTLLQLDVATNDLPASTLGVAIGASLRGSGVPSFVRVATHGGADGSPSLVTVPAKRVRAANALLQWALSQARSCQALAKPPRAQAAQQAQQQGGGAAAAAAQQPQGGGDQAAAAAPRRSEWLDDFLESGLPALTASLDRQLRHKAEALIRQRAELVASEHARLVERRGPLMTMGVADAELLVSNEWAHENDELIEELIEELGELLGAGRATKQRAGEGEGGAAAAEQLLRDAELRLMAARQLDSELAQRASLALAAAAAAREQQRPAEAEG